MKRSFGSKKGWFQPDTRKRHWGRELYRRQWGQSNGRGRSGRNVCAECDIISFVMMRDKRGPVVTRASGPADLFRMRLLGGNGGVSGILGYRGNCFLGYALRTDDGWVCVASLGMNWTELKCRTSDDCRTMLRATCHVNRFDDFRDVSELTSVVLKLPPHLQPAIMPADIPGIPARLPKLSV